MLSAGTCSVGLPYFHVEDTDANVRGCMMKAYNLFPLISFVFHMVSVYQFSGFVVATLLNYGYPTHRDESASQLLFW